MNDLPADSSSDLLCYGWYHSLLTNMNDLLALTLLWWQSPWTWTQTSVWLFYLTFSVLFSGLSHIGLTLWIISFLQWLPAADCFCSHLLKIFLNKSSNEIPPCHFLQLCALFSPSVELVWLVSQFFLSVTVPAVVPVDSAIAVNPPALAGDNRPLSYHLHFVTPPHRKVTSQKLYPSYVNGQAKKHPLFPNSLQSTWSLTCTSADS